MTFSCVPPTELMLEVAASIQDQSWHHSQQFTTPRGSWNAYLNQICLHTFLPWLQAEYAPEATIWSAHTLDSLWDLVNGTVIQLAGKRLVLIPDKNLETREITVPQEWVDIPSWAGDYYLAVQVNLEGDWVRCWGYTTHEQLKTSGHYDPIDRTYNLDATQLIEDLNAFWVVRQLYPNEPTQAVIPALPPLSDAQAATYLDLLTTAIAPPRLQIPFEQWGALLERSDWRQQLCQQRQQQQQQTVLSNSDLSNSGLSNSDLSTPTQSTTAIPAHLTRLSQWLQDQFDQTWQAIEDLFTAQPALAHRLRQSPNLNPALVRRARRIAIAPTADLVVVLVVVVDPEPDGRMGIQIQLYPLDPSRLPANLQLTMLSTSGAVVQSVQADEQADYIQLKRFKCPPGRPFTVQVTIEQFIHIEEFLS